MKQATIKMKNKTTYRLKCDVKKCSDRLNEVCLAMAVRGDCPELVITGKKGKRVEPQEVIDLIKRELLSKSKRMHFYRSRNGD